MIIPNTIHILGFSKNKLAGEKAINEVKFGKVEFRESVKLFSVYKYLINLNLIN